MGQDDAQERWQAATLTVLNGPLRGARYLLGERTTTATLGRTDAVHGQSPTLDLTFADPHSSDGRRPSLSRSHAKIERQGGMLTLTDLGSQNGTFVNGNRLAPGKPRRLRHRDRIHLGQVALHVTLERQWTALPRPRSRAGLTAAAAGVALALALALWPGLIERVTTLPERLQGHWTPAACHAYPAACAAALGLPERT